MNKLPTILICVLLLLKFSANGQNTNNYWYFGLHAGMMFDSLGAHATTGNVFATEGVASISDGCGLLFYTTGDTVWNKNHQMMINGFNIGGRCTAYFNRSSSTQAALIVRQPASDSIFYIFTTDCIEDNLADGLRYSIVNMNMDNGLGAVILKNQLLFAPSEEKLTAAKHDNGCDIWIISHEYKTNNFYSFLLSSSGLNTTPVISSSGQIHDAPNPTYFNARGYLKASPNGEKLINVNPDGAYSWADTTLPELFNFNKLNGTVASDLVFPMDTSFWWTQYSSWTIPFYGASFSPDNSKLYLSSGFYGPNLYQYDLNAGSNANIIASKTYLAYPYNRSAIQQIIPCALVNAPDGKMYVAQLSSSFLGVINNPDSAGVLCNYNDSAISLLNGTRNDYGGLPNFFEDYINPRLLKANFSYYQSAIGDTLFFTNSSVAATNYAWYFGDETTSQLQSPFHIFTDTGYYSVSLFASNGSCDVDRICQTVYVSSTTGLTEVTNSIDFTISPNPFMDEITVNVTPIQNLKTELYNALGEKLRSIDITGKQKITIQIGQEISAGIYFLQLRNKNFVLTKKLMKL